MRSEISATVLAFALGLIAAADAKPMDATCRTMNSGAVSRVCRWSVGQGHTVDVYYGEPGKRAAAQPPPAKTAPAAAPVYSTAMAYEDYGYPYVLFAPGFERRFSERRFHDRDRRVGLAGEAPEGRLVGFRGGMRSGASRGAMMVGRR